MKRRSIAKLIIPVLALAVCSSAAVVLHAGDEDIPKTDLVIPQTDQESVPAPAPLEAQDVPAASASLDTPVAVPAPDGMSTDTSVASGYSGHKEVALDAEGEVNGITVRGGNDESFPRYPGVTIIFSQNDTVVAEVISDNNGEFVVAGLEPGDYAVTATGTGGAQGVYDVTVKAAEEFTNQAEAAGLVPTSFNTVQGTLVLGVPDSSSPPGTPSSTDQPPLDFVPGPGGGGYSGGTGGTFGGFSGGGGGGGFGGGGALGTLLGAGLGAGIYAAVDDDNGRRRAASPN